MPGRTLSVTGHGIAVAAPDRAIIQFAVMSEGDDAEEAFRENEAATQRVLTAVRRFGIADREISLLGLGLQPSGGGRNPDYVASRSVQVTLDDLRRVPDLIATVVAQGGNRLGGLTYTVRDWSALRETALAQAVEQARRRAEVAAEAAGVRLGAVRTVVETSPRGPSAFGDALTVLYERPMLRQESGLAGAYSAGETRAEAHVTVQFDIE